MAIAILYVQLKCEQNNYQTNVLNTTVVRIGTNGVSGVLRDGEGLAVDWQMDV